MNVLWLGSNQPYTSIHSRMKDLLDRRVANEIEDHLLLVEHQPTYTTGRRKESSQNLLDPQDIPVVPIERGGDVTFHGPGQLTGYPILKLPDHRKDLHAYLRFLEDFWIEFLHTMNIQATRDQRNTGVWADQKKLVAIGIACRRWVTWHGFACNVSVDLEYYRRINPCGMDSSLVTNISCYQPIETMEHFAETVGQQFAQKWADWIHI
jgi:lipoyl(octanoyl) transferase